MITIYEGIYSALTAIGLIGLFYYVRETWRIADATKNHTKIVTRPAVTVKLIPHLIDENNQLKYKKDHICLSIINHSTIHANIKILIKYEIVEKLEDVTLKIKTPIKVGNYNGKEIWNVSANDKIIGHTVLNNLIGKELNKKDTIIINIKTCVTPYGIDSYEDNPLVQYHWDNSRSVWIPDLVPN